MALCNERKAGFFAGLTRRCGRSALFIIVDGERAGIFFCWLLSPMGPQIARCLF